MGEIVVKAGTRGDGQSVYERIPVEPLGENIYRLLRSPAFAPGIARGDSIKLLEGGSYDVIERSGFIRLFARAGISAMAATLGPALNSFDGEIEHEDERMLVFSVPFSAGFNAIEAVMTQLLEGDGDAAWRYGNVYDSEGEPLNWWSQPPRS